MHARRGSGPIHLLVVLSLLAASAGMLLPAVQKARAANDRVRCAENLGRIGKALHEHETARGSLPKSSYFPNSYWQETTHGGPYVRLLPYLGHEELARKYDLTKDYFDPANAAVVATRVPVFNCPAAPQGLVSGDDWPSAKRYRGAVIDFVAPSGNWAKLGPPDDTGGEAALNGSLGRLPKLAMVTDGLSTTVGVVEQAAGTQHWVRGERVDQGRSARSGATLGSGSMWVMTYSADGLTGLNRSSKSVLPCSINCNNEDGIYAFHTGGANALFMDGSVKFLREGLDGYVLFALVSRAGGEVISPNDF